LVSKGVDVTSDTAFSSDIADVSMELSKHDDDKEESLSFSSPK
jgi:hypothetical protein